jgi:hypothetical protein
MASTTSFNWETPDDTDLVKDGAAAIRTLGNSIDTSMTDLLGGTTGQVLAKASNTNMDFTWVAQDDSNAIQNAIVDAKGDLIAATAADTPARLAVGTNGQILTADSTAATGLAWATPASGATDNFQLINAGGTALTGASTITVSSISGKNRLYVRIVGASSVSASSYFLLRLNTDSGLNYEYAITQSDNEISTSNDKFLLGRMGTAAGDTFGGYWLIDGTNASGRKPFQGIGIGTGTAPRNYNISGSYFGTSTISSVSIISETGNFDAGTIYVYGA